eukprot:538054-Rhodomonas_salina.3
MVPAPHTANVTSRAVQTTHQEVQIELANKKNKRSTCRSAADGDVEENLGHHGAGSRPSGLLATSEEVAKHLHTRRGLGQGRSAAVGQREGRMAAEAQARTDRGYRGEAEDSLGGDNEEEGRPEHGCVRMRGRGAWEGVSVRTAIADIL